MNLTGFLAVNKPKGFTSHDVVAKLRQLLHIKRIGHGGTLDPIATGVLPIAVGEITRFFEYIPDRTKIYLAEITFGIITDTLDMDGKIEEQIECPEINREAVEKELGQFLGRQEQVPPLVSAKHYKGKRLYQLAREGKAVEVPPKEIYITVFDMLEFTRGVHPKALFNIQCSEGTYVRALARDLGKALGVPAVLSWLERTRSGPFLLESSVSLEEVKLCIENGDGVENLFIPVEEVLSLPIASLMPRDLSRILNGNDVKLPKRFLPYDLDSKVLIKGTDNCCYGVGVLKGCVATGFVTLYPLKILSGSVSKSKMQSRSVLADARFGGG